MILNFHCVLRVFCDFATPRAVAYVSFGNARQCWENPGFAFPSFLLDRCNEATRQRSDITDRLWVGKNENALTQFVVWFRDDSVLEFPMSPMGFPWSHGIPMGMGIAKLVSWEWEWEWKRLMGMRGIKTTHFPTHRPQVADHQTLLMDSLFLRSNFFVEC